MGENGAVYISRSGRRGNRSGRSAQASAHCAHCDYPCAHCGKYKPLNYGISTFREKLPLAEVDFQHIQARRNLRYIKRLSGAAGRQLAGEHRTPLHVPAA